jgi:D-3-phosphoglycerate dehydrogenase
MKKVVYYNMNQDLDYEKSLLNDWNVKDLELVAVKGDDPVTDLDGAESVTLEYTEMSQETLAALKDLKIVALQSIGFDEIDIEAATAEGICVTNAPGFCSYEVASHVMAMILNINRKIVQFDRRVKSGIWGVFAEGPLHRLKGQKVGLISFGSIPQELVPMLLGFGIDVLVYDPYVSDDVMEKYEVSRCGTLEDLLKEADVVSVHSPLLESTKGMIGTEVIAMMKDGAVFINASRGALVDEDALYAALTSGKLSAAGLDVLCDEKSHNSTLIELDNVIATPHAGFYSEEALLDSRRIALEQIVTRLCVDEKPRCLVNKDLEMKKEVMV